VTEVIHGLDFQTFASHEAETLQLNAIGKVRIVTHKAMFFDAYSSNRATGSFIMVDPATNDTVGAGMVSAEDLTVHDSAPYQAAVPLPATYSTGLTVWFTGLSGAGKTTICSSVYTELLALGFRVEVLDGDVIRRKLNSDLGFSQKDRDENVRRIAFVAQLLATHGVIVLVAAISPYREVREEIRRDNPNFIEVYVNAPLEICEQRDPKGLYKRARNKEIEKFTGIDDPYQPPLVPEVECRTDRETVKASSARVVSAIQFFFASRLNKDEGQAMSCPDAGRAEIAEQSRIQSNREDCL
jgi:adenylyl-sulfate kinase